MCQNLNNANLNALLAFPFKVFSLLYMKIRGEKTF